MTPREYQIGKLKELQDELRALNKKRDLLKKKIKNQIKVIDTIDDDIKLSRKIKIDYMQRDVDLCKGYINHHGRVYTADLIKYLNEELKDQHRRWSGELDSNRFMGAMGQKLKDSGVKYEFSTNGNRGRRTTVWLKS